MREHVAGVDSVAHLHLDRAGPQMRVRGVVPFAQLLDDVIAGERVVGNRHRELAAVGDVLGNAVLHLDDLAVGDRVNLLIPGVIALVVVLVAGERFAVVAKLNPVDRIALADMRLAVNRQHRAAMRRGVRGAVSREPIFSAKRRMNHDRIVLVQIERGGVNCSGAAALAVLLDRNRSIKVVGIALVGKPIGKDKEDAGLARLEARIVGLGAVAVQPARTSRPVACQWRTASTTICRRLFRSRRAW